MSYFILKMIYINVLILVGMLWLVLHCQCVFFIAICKIKGVTYRKKQKDFLRNARYILSRKPNFLGMSLFGYNLLGIFIGHIVLINAAIYFYSANNLMFSFLVFYVAGSILLWKKPLQAFAARAAVNYVKDKCS